MVLKDVLSSTRFKHATQIYIIRDFDQRLAWGFRSEQRGVAHVYRHIDLSWSGQLTFDGREATDMALDYGS